MIIDYIKGLLFWIFIVFLLLCVCVSVDYADDNITVTANQSQVNVTNCTEINGVHYDDMIVNRSKNHIHTYNVVSVKPKYPIVSMWARPSVRCGLPYKWYYRSFVDYCPHCHRYGVLYDAHKYQARFEHEWTCRRCGADYDAVIGKEKYSWSRYYLRRA